MLSLNKLHNIKIILGVLLLCLTQLAWSQCTLTSVSPTNITFSPASNSAPSMQTVQVTMNCPRSSSYQIMADSSFYDAQIGSSSNKIRGVFTSDSAGNTPLYNTPASGAASGSGGSTSKSIYIKLSSSTGGNITGLGSYTLQMTGRMLSSSNNTPFTITISGDVGGTCTLSSGASIPYGTVPSGANPISSTNIIVSCTSGLPWTMTSPAGGGSVMSGTTKIGTAWAFSDSAATQSLVDSSKSGVGNGSSTFTPVYVRLDGLTRGTPLTGTGSFTGTVQINLSY